MSDTAKPDTMSAHSFDVTWTFVVPPANTTRVLITQRQDGPFRGDQLGRAGYYYVSLEQLNQWSIWEHVTGSTMKPGGSSFDSAWLAAQELWLAECRKVAAPA